MKTNLIAAAVSMACASAMLSVATPVFAQSDSGLSRAQVQKECSSYMKTHQWSESKGWHLKPGMKAPAQSVKTNAEVTAETIAFLRDNRWDEAKSRFVSIKGAPRDVRDVARRAAERSGGVSSELRVGRGTERFHPLQAVGTQVRRA